MKLFGRLLKSIFALIAIGVVVGGFILIFNALAPRRDGDLLVTSSAFPTPASWLDLPLGLYLQQRQAELNTPASDDPTPVLFSILPGELPADVSARLQNQGIINDADLFLKLIRYEHIDTKIQAGEYVLRRSMKMGEIVEALQHGRARAFAALIRPGWRAEEIADYLVSLGLVNFNRDRFLQLVKEGAFDYAFLRDRPRGALPTNEGFLFPETYHVPLDIPHETLITLMLDTFRQRVTDKMRLQAASAKLTMFEVVTLASIVEREAAVPSERPIIASVYLNRLKKKLLLQADPTVQYAIGFQAGTKQWWKTPVTLEEYQHVESPYNTYLHAGLPPGPICNPSLASITAVLEPDQTEFLYFLAKGDGSHAFAKTYEEHQQNLQRYGYRP